MCQAPPLSVPSRPSLGFVVQTSSSSPCSRAALLPPLPLLLPTAGSTPPFPRAVAHASPYHASSLSSAPAHVVHLRAPVQHVLAFIVWSCSSKIWTSLRGLRRWYLERRPRPLITPVSSAYSWVAWRGHAIPLTWAPLFQRLYGNSLLALGRGCLTFAALSSEKSLC